MPISLTTTGMSDGTRRAVGWIGAGLVHVIIVYLLLFAWQPLGRAPMGVGHSDAAMLKLFSLPSGGAAAGVAQDREVAAGKAPGDAGTTPAEQEVHTDPGGIAQTGAQKGQGTENALNSMIAGAIADDPLGGQNWYRDRLRQHLAEHRQAPGKGAGPRSGVVVIRFTLSREGRVIDARVAASRGASLDQAALATLWQAEPLPAVPASLPAPIEVDVPLEFVERR